MQIAHFPARVKLSAHPQQPHLLLHPLFAQQHLLPQSLPGRRQPCLKLEPTAQPARMQKRHRRPLLPAPLPQAPPLQYLLRVQAQQPNPHPRCPGLAPRYFPRLPAPQQLPHQIGSPPTSRPKPAKPPLPFPWPTFWPTAHHNGLLLSLPPVWTAHPPRLAPKGGFDPFPMRALQCLPQIPWADSPGPAPAIRSQAAHVRASTPPAIGPIPPTRPLLRQNMQTSRVCPRPSIPLHSQPEQGPGHPAPSPIAPRRGQPLWIGPRPHPIPLSNRLWLQGALPLHLTIQSAPETRP